MDIVTVQGMLLSVADPGEERGGPLPPMLFWVKKKKKKKIAVGRKAGKVWIRHRL